MSEPGSWWQREPVRRPTMFERLAKQKARRSDMISEEKKNWLIATLGLALAEEILAKAQEDSKTLEEMGIAYSDKGPEGAADLSLTEQADAVIEATQALLTKLVTASADGDEDAVLALAHLRRQARRWGKAPEGETAEAKVVLDDRSKGARHLLGFKEEHPLIVLGESFKRQPEKTGTYLDKMSEERLAAYKSKTLKGIENRAAVMERLGPLTPDD